MNLEKEDPRKPTLAERREILIMKCEVQRNHLGREIGMLRAPTTLTGGGILQSITAGRFKVPLAIAGMLLGAFAARPAGMVPMLGTGMSLFKLAKSAWAMIRSRTS